MAINIRLYVDIFGKLYDIKLHLVKAPITWDMRNILQWVLLGNKTLIEKCTLLTVPVGNNL